MSEEQARAIMYAVVEWLHDHRRIPESIYGNMTIDGDGADGQDIIAEIQHAYEQ